MRKTIVSLLPVYLAAFTFVALLCVGIAVASAPRVPRKQLPPPDPTAEGVWYRNVNRWLDTAHWNAVATWNYKVAAWQYQAAVNANRAEAAAASVKPAPVPTVSRASTAPSGGGTSVPAGGACGGATNGADAYIQRESGGNPNAVNPSGARGCYQLMPMHFGSGGVCSDLTPGAGDAACASRLPLSAWSSSGPTG